MNTRLFSVLLCCGLAASCGDDNSSHALACAVADSAGVQLVSNSAQLDAEAARSYAASPSASLGAGAAATDGRPPLSRVRDATRLQDGTVVVADGGSASLVVFDADGSHADTWGRKGQGPGEFTGLASVASWRGDSIAAWDMWQNRVSVFDDGGIFGRSFRLLPTEESAPRVIDVKADGTVLAVILPSIGPGERRSGVVRRDRDYVILDDEGYLQASLGTFPGPEGYVDLSGDFLMSWVLPFGRSTVAAFWQDWVVVGTNDQYEIRSYRTDGALHRLVRRNHDVASPTQADLDAHVEALLADMPREERAVQEASAAKLPLVDAYPAYGRVRGDPQGRLWVEDYRLPGYEARTWTVYDGQGCVREVVELPEGLDVYEIGRDYVLGKAVDELGVERVQLWPLQ